MTETYSVVIVEDEPYAARHIKALIEREKNFRVSAVYDNGEDALCALASTRLRADLLVTDIQMPGISGLNLIKEVQRVRPGIPSIIISGYSSFAYAKEAISLGTMQYILKPIDVEELKAALQEVYRELQRRDTEVRGQLVWKIQKNSEEAFGSEKAFAEDVQYRVMVFALSLSTEETISRCIGFFLENDYRVLNYRYSIVLLQTGKTEPLEVAAEKIKGTICGKDIHGVFVIGADFVPGRKVKLEIEKLYEILQSCFRLGETKIIMEYEENIKQHTETEEYHLLTTQLLQQVNARKISGLKTVYDRMFDFFGRKKASVREMRYTLYMLISRIYQLDAERFDPTIESNRIMRILYASKDYGEAGSKIWGVIEQLAQKRQTEKEHPDSGAEVYWKILHFLNTNISENYSLQEIADNFHISQPYLSKLFRKYNGVSYKEYCTNLKVQTSIRLMEENPNMLIKDIAERVGYDQIYFSAVFYRVMGEYPKQYRSRFESG